MRSRTNRTAGLLALGLLVAWALPAQAAPKLTHARTDVRIASHELTDAGLVVRVEARDSCAVKVGGEDRDLVCSDWAPLPPVGPSRKLVFKGDLLVKDKTKAMVLRGAHDGGEEHSARIRLGDSAWVALEPREEGWLLRPGALGAWGLRGEADWTLDLSVRAGEAALSILEGAPLALPSSTWGRFTPTWACDGLRWLTDNWAAGGVRPAAVAAVPEDACPDVSAAARAASCADIDVVGHVLAQSGDLQTLTDLVPDGEALVAACPDAQARLQTSGDLAREYLVTTQDGGGLIALATTWGDVLGPDSAARIRKAGADAALQESRRTGDTSSLSSFLAAFPDAEESTVVATALLSISAKLSLPCGSKRGCPHLEADSRIDLSWTDVPGKPAAARLVAWSKAEGGVPIADALKAWAPKAPEDEVNAAAEALRGTSSPAAWGLDLPFALKRLGDASGGFAVELQPEGLPAVLVPIRLEASWGEFPGLSRVIRLRADGAERQDQPGGEVVPLANVPLDAHNHRVHGRSLYVWTRYSPEQGIVGPEPAGLVRVDLDVGGITTLLSGEPVDTVRSVGEALVVRVGSGCSLEAALAAGRSDAGDPSTHPGAAGGPPESECREVALGPDGPLEDGVDLTPAPPAPEAAAPEGLAIVTDQVAGTEELFVVEQATGRRLQVSRAHALRKDYVVPEGCEATAGFASRWYVDGRLLVHHELALCGEVRRGPLMIVSPTDGAALPLAGDTDGLPAWLDRSWAHDREAILTADGTVVQGPDVLPGDPAVLAAWWYRPRLVDVLR